MKIKYTKLIDNEYHMISLPSADFYWSKGAYCLTITLIMFQIHFWFGKIEHIE